MSDSIETLAIGISVCVDVVFLSALLKDRLPSHIFRDDSTLFPLEQVVHSIELL